jgi:hypothetical protein
VFPAGVESLSDIVCFFCDAPADKRLVLLEEFIFLPQKESDKKHAESTNNFIKTGRLVCLQPGGSHELKRLMPSFSYDRWPSDHVKVEYTEKGFGIHPLPDGELHLQRGSAEPKRLEKYQGLKQDLREQYEEPYQIHIGKLVESHVVWQFQW